MDNSRNRKNKPSRPVSLDGISRPKSIPRSGGSIDFNKPGQLQARKPLDDFSRAEGFTMTNPGKVRNNVPSKETEPPIEIDPSPKSRFQRPKSEKTKKRRFGSMSRRKKVFLSFLVLVFIFVGIGGFLFAKGYINLNKILSGGGGAAALQENVDPSLLKREGDGRINILMMGRGGLGHEGADLTDTIIVVSINPMDKEAGLVSIPRDLYVTVPQQGSMKINSVFYTGKMSVLNNSSKQTDEVKKKADKAGLDLAEKTVEEILGIPIHYNAMIDFKGFREAIDTVGGIDVEVPSAVYEQMRIDGKNYILDVKPGRQHLDGFKALAYARSRYTSARGDFDRAERQRLIILALTQKIFNLGTYSNPAKISQLLTNFGDHIQTNFSVQDLNQLYGATKDIHKNNTVSIGLVDPPYDHLTTGNLDGLSVVLPKAGLDMYADIHFYIRNFLRDGFIKKENSGIAIYNGSQTPGAATEKANELKSYGYNILAIDNAPNRNQGNIILVDLTDGKDKYTKRYLELRLKTTAVSSLPDGINPGNADFVIILGSR